LPTSLTCIGPRLEAAHLGDLLRLWVRPRAKSITSKTCPDLQGPSGECDRTDHLNQIRSAVAAASASPANLLPRLARPYVSTRTDISCRLARRRLRVNFQFSRLRYRFPYKIKYNNPRAGAGILTGFPFEVSFFIRDSNPILIRPPQKKH